MCLSVQAITFEPLQIETSFLTISRSSSWGQGQVQKNYNLFISTYYCFVCGYRSLIRSRSNIMTYLSLFLVRSVLSMPSIRFSKHCTMAPCLSAGWPWIICCFSWVKYCKTHNLLRQLSGFNRWVNYNDHSDGKNVDFDKKNQWLLLFPKFVWICLTQWTCLIF